MMVPVERLLNQILYCNFVLESILSDYALLALCTEILKEKKVQPVGEVGKMLAEITSSPNLSAKLKEKFGGLKKFLEYFSGRFVFSNDHPFNPSVTLRSILDAMNLEPSEKGVVNLTNIYKARKVKLTCGSLSAFTPFLTYSLHFHCNFSERSQAHLSDAVPGSFVRQHAERPGLALLPARPAHAQWGQHHADVLDEQAHLADCIIRPRQATEASAN